MTDIKNPKDIRCTILQSPQEILKMMQAELQKRTTHLVQTPNNGLVAIEDMSNVELEENIQIVLEKIKSQEIINKVTKIDKNNQNNAIESGE